MPGTFNMLTAKNNLFKIDMKKLENRTVFITGGLSGIGKACALAAAGEGANLAIADLKSDEGLKAMEEIKSENSKAIFIACDVSRFTDTQTAIEKTVSTFGSLDVALNNAGIVAIGFLQIALIFEMLKFYFG